MPEGFQFVEATQSMFTNQKGEATFTFHPSIIARNITLVFTVEGMSWFYALQDKQIAGLDMFANVWFSSFLRSGNAPCYSC